jgi:hypothetical protein
MEPVRKILTKRYEEWFKGFTPRPVQGSPAPARPTLVVIVGRYDLDNNGKQLNQKTFL